MWCNTVASFYNWRVVKQENILNIEDMISALDGHQNVKKQFSHLLNPEKESAPLKEENGRVKVCLQHEVDNQWVRAKKVTTQDKADKVTIQNIFRDGVPERLDKRPFPNGVLNIRTSPNELEELTQWLDFWRDVSHIIDIADVNAGDEWFFFEGCFATINGQRRVSNK